MYYYVFHGILPFVFDTQKLVQLCHCIVLSALIPSGLLKTIQEGNVIEENVYAPKKKVQDKAAWCPNKRA